MRTFILKCLEKYREPTMEIRKPKTGEFQRGVQMKEGINT